MRVIAGRLLLLAVALAVVVGPSRAPVEAESYDYTPKTRQVKACILLLDSFKVGGQPENPDPHVFYLLDSEAKGTAKGLKPRDWEIVNPRAAGRHAGYQCAVGCHRPQRGLAAGFPDR